MKMKFIPLLFVLGLITANSQITTTTGAKVFVNSGTLVYSTGDFKVLAGTGKVTNNGNIKISNQGTLITESIGTTNPDMFVLGYTGEKDYGQLIIVPGAKSPSGKITVMRDIGDDGTGTSGFFGTPFKDYKFSDFISDLTEGDLTSLPKLPCDEGYFAGCKGTKYNTHPIFLWNSDNIQYEPAGSYSAQDGTFKPGYFYNIRRNVLNKFVTDSGLPAKDYFAAGPKSFRGVPYIADASNTTNLNYPVRTRTIGGGATNDFGLPYFSYMSDLFATGVSEFNNTTTEAFLTSQDYGNRTLTLTNPYTSNLDIKELTDDYNNLIGAGTNGVTTTKPGTTSRYVGKIFTSTVAGGTMLGDNIRYIPPMTNFFLKVKADSGPIAFVNSSAAQTFTIGEYSKSMITGGDIPQNQKIATDNTLKAAKTAAVNNVEVYQLRLNLMNKDKTTLYDRTYVAVGRDLVTGELNQAESLSDVSENAGVFTLPEAKTGGVAAGYENTRLGINVVNQESTKVAIPVGIQSYDGATSFTLTAQLKENEDYIPQGRINFDNSSAKFYFHDIEKGKVVEIDSNFSYPITVKDGEAVTDKYEIFWGAYKGMGNENIEDLPGLTPNLNKSETIIYKTGSDYKVRFNTDWKKAEVSIFNVLGQLISTEKNINTQSDYLLPINGSSTMYVIKVVSENGETVTKKIVK